MNRALSLKRTVIVKLLRMAGLYNFAKCIQRRGRMWSAWIKYKRIQDDFTLPLPNVFMFEPTARCNLDCHMCYFKKEFKSDKELTFDQIKMLIEKLPPITRMSLIGGELFLWKDIFRLLDTLCMKKIPLHIATNATLINESNIENLKRNDNIETIAVSLDGTRELHDYIRGVKGAYERTIRAIQLMKENFFVAIVCTITKMNLPYLSRVVSLAGELNLDSINFEYERKYLNEDMLYSRQILGVPKEALSVNYSKERGRGYSIEELGSSLKAAEKEGRRIGVKVYYMPPFLTGELSNCYWRKLRKNGRYLCRAIFASRIDSGGNVFHCYAVRQKFGNLLHSSFKDIWNGREYRDFRRRLLENNLLPICETCYQMERMG